MNADRDVTRTVRSWLEERVTALPDRVLDAVLDQVPATPQRRPMWSARRLPSMNRFLPLAATAAVLVIAALVAVQILRPASNVGPPSATAAPTATSFSTPAASAARLQLSRSSPGFLEPGDYALDAVIGSPITITIPADWTGLEHGTGNALLVKTAIDDSTGKRGAFGSVGNNVLLGFYAVDRVFVNPCKDVSGATPAPSDINAYVDALSHAVGMTAEAVTDVTIGGLPAKQVDLVNQIDQATCVFTPFNQWSYVGQVGTGGGNGTSSPGDQRIWLLNVGGHSLLINFEGSVADGSPAMDVAELNAIVAGIRFQ